MTYVTEDGHMPNVTTRQYLNVMDTLKRGMEQAHVDSRCTKMFARKGKD